MSEVYEGQDPYIFISHSTEDMGDLRPFLTAMRLSGYRFWLDQGGMAGGRSLSSEISKRISDCAVFMTFLSRHSTDSDRSEWCKNELKLAKDEKKYIFPVLWKLSEQDIPKDFQIQLGDRLYYPAQDPLREESVRAFIEFLDKCAECVSCKEGDSSEISGVPSASADTRTETEEALKPDDIAPNPPENIEYPVKRVFDVESIILGFLVLFGGVLFAGMGAYLCYNICLDFYNRFFNDAPFLYQFFPVALLILALLLFYMAQRAFQKAHKCFSQPKFYMKGRSLAIKQGKSAKVVWVPALAREDIHVVTLADDVTDIDVSFFDRCPNLEKIDVSIDNTQYRDIHGVLFGKMTKELLRYPKNRPDKTYEIPAKTRAIRSGAFDGCRKLIAVTIPEKAKLAEISKKAFCGCGSLTRVVLSHGVRKIHVEAFRDCHNLENIKIPDSVYEIHEKAFGGCKKLSCVETPAEEHIHIFENAFECETTIKYRRVSKNKLEEFT